MSVAVKKVIMNLYWQFVHLLGHFFDYDNDGNLDFDDMKVAFNKFVEVAPEVAADVVAWNGMDIGQKIGAVASAGVKGLPDKYAGMKSWVVGLLEVGSHIKAKLDAAPDK